MKSQVTFRCPEPFVPLGEEDGILSVKGAGWFVKLLQRIPSLEVEENLCQEDWGIVVFVRRNKKRFWMGLSVWPEGDSAWLVHIHHRSYGWLQRLSASGKEEFKRLVADIHKVLTSDSAISEVRWYRESDRTFASSAESPFD